jgi:hypothetical protein
MKYGNVFKLKLDSGSSLEEAILHLRMMGASPMEIMKALMQTKRISLGEAKMILGKSEAWKDMARNADKMHKRILTTIKRHLTSRCS